MILAQIHYNLSWIEAQFPRIISKNGQNDLEGDFSPNLWRVIVRTAEFPRILSQQKGHNDFDGQGHWPPFQYQLRVSQDACFVQTWWFYPKSMTSYRADKVKFTNGQTDGRTDGQTDGRTYRGTDGQTRATTIFLRPERPRDKMYCIKSHFDDRMIKSSSCCGASLRLLSSLSRPPLHIYRDTCIITGEYFKVELVDGMACFVSNGITWHD